MQKIVTIGGGTGHYQILRGLKNRDCEITAIVNVCDNGGHSGNLRDEYGVLPPGDSRQCLIALANEETTLRKLFEHRIKTISFGNLFIAGLEDLYGSASIALKEAGKILNISGRVIPVSEDSFHINAELEDKTILKGQTEVSYPSTNKKIIRLFPDSIPHINRDAAIAIKEADKIVICPGDLYGSILPNFLVSGVNQALQESKAKLIYICNLVTKEGNYDFKTSDFVKEIERYSGKKIDKTIVNTRIPSNIVIQKYLDEHSKIIENDLTENIIKADILEEYESKEKIIIRHHPIKTAKEIIGA